MVRSAARASGSTGSSPTPFPPTAGEGRAWPRRFAATPRARAADRTGEPTRGRRGSAPMVRPGELVERASTSRTDEHAPARSDTSLRPRQITSIPDTARTASRSDAPRRPASHGGGRRRQLLALTVPDGRQRAGRAPGHTEHPADGSRDRRRRCDAAAPGGDPRAGRSRADRGQPPRLAALATGPPGLIRRAGRSGSPGSSAPPSRRPSGPDRQPSGCPMLTIQLTPNWSRHIPNSSPHI